MYMIHVVPISYRYLGTGSNVPLPVLSLLCD